MNELLKTVFEYYAIECAVNEYNSNIVAQWPTLELAKEDMKNRADWYRPEGTGQIIKVSIQQEIKTGKLYIDKEKVFENR